MDGTSSNHANWRSKTHCPINTKKWYFLCCTWLESIDNISSEASIENISKAVIRLPKNLRFQFFKDFKENAFSNYYRKLKDFERWLGKKIDEFFNPTSALSEHQGKHLRVYQRGSEKENKLTHRTFCTLGVFDGQTNNIRCWLCNQNNEISECTQLIALPVDDRKKTAFVSVTCQIRI